MEREPMGGYFIGEGGRVASVNMINVAKPVHGSFLGCKVALKLVRALLDWAKSQNANIGQRAFIIKFFKLDLNTND